MKDKRKEIEATPRKTARAGKFQADLAPAEILDEDAIIAQWAASTAISQIQAKTMLTSLECFIMDALGKGHQLNFSLASFYPRLSGALSTRDADPDADALYVRGAVKARRPLVEGLRNKLKAVNRTTPVGPIIFSILDKDANKGNVLAAGHVLSVVGSDLAFDQSRDGEGVWLERRSKKQGLVRVARARMLKMENSHLEFVFDAPIPRGNYLIAIYTRSGKGPDYKAIRVCREAKAI
jgi:hypothetical protein